MSQLDKEREHAFRLAEEHRVLAEHYLTRNARLHRDHRLKAQAWFEYAAILPTLPIPT
jgi:hypothetical protein